MTQPDQGMSSGALKKTSENGYVSSVCVRKCTERTTARCEVNKLGENLEETYHPKNEELSGHLDFCMFQTSTMDTYSAFPFRFL